jgi:hypothetical protein
MCPDNVNKTAQPKTGDGSELQTVDGRGQMADGRGIVPRCSLQPAVGCLPSAVRCRLLSYD